MLEIKYKTKGETTITMAYDKREMWMWRYSRAV